MNFSQIYDIDIPEGDLKKIEKDGVVLWHKREPEWERDESIVIYNKKVGLLNYQDSYKWTIEKYNIGSVPSDYASYFPNNIPNQTGEQIQTSGGFSCGFNYGSYPSAVIVRSNKYTYNDYWFAKSFNSLRFYPNSIYARGFPGGATFTTDIKIYNENNLLLGTANFTVGGEGSAPNSIPLNDAGKAYFNSDSATGKSFYIRMYTNDNVPYPLYNYASVTMYISTDRSYPGDGAPVLYFQ